MTNEKIMELISDCIEAAFTVCDTGHVDDCLWLEDFIPDIYKLVHMKEHEQFKPVYWLFSRWLDAVTHHEKFLSFDPKISVEKAQKLLEIVVECYRNNKEITDPEILEFSKGPDGCYIGSKHIRSGLRGLLDLFKR